MPEKDAKKENLPENTGTVRSGGLYGKVKMSVRAANILVAVLLAALVCVGVFVIKHNGFTVEFDTDGGSQIQSVKAYHSELLDVSEQPVKEGYTFTGWYTDRACTDKSYPRFWADLAALAAVPAAEATKSNGGA